jgi:hypothetical protein
MAQYGSVRELGKRLPHDVLNEAVKLRMEGDSYREIAAKLHLRSHTSLEPHLKGVTKGVKEGPAVIEVPVQARTSEADEGAHPREREAAASPLLRRYEGMLGQLLDSNSESSEAMSAVAQALGKLSDELQASRDEGQQERLMTKLRSQQPKTKEERNLADRMKAAELKMEWLAGEKEETKLNMRYLAAAAFILTEKVMDMKATIDLMIMYLWRAQK